MSHLIKVVSGIFKSGLILQSHVKNQPAATYRSMACFLQELERLEEIISKRPQQYQI